MSVALGDRGSRGAEGRSIAPGERGYLDCKVGGTPTLHIAGNAVPVLALSLIRRLSLTTTVATLR